AAVSGHEGGSVQVWDLRSKACVHRFSGQHQGLVNVVAADFANHRAASGSDDAVLCLWDLSAMACIYRIDGAPMMMAVWAISRDFASSFCAMSGSWDGNLQIWDIKDAAIRGNLRGAGVCSLAVDFAAQRAISGTYGGQLCIWDLASIVKDKFQIYQVDLQFLEHVTLQVLVALCVQFDAGVDHRKLSSFGYRVTHTHILPFRLSFGRLFCSSPLGMCAVLVSDAQEEAKVQRMVCPGPWECEDAWTAVYLYLGSVAVCEVSSVSRTWRCRACDPALWAQLLPGAGVVARNALSSGSTIPAGNLLPDSSSARSHLAHLGPWCLSQPVQAVREGRCLATAELGGKKAVVAMLDLLGDTLALCEEPVPGREYMSQAVEVYDLSSQNSVRRYEAAVRGASALRILDDGIHLLVAGDWNPHPVSIINCQHTPEEFRAAATLARAGRGPPADTTPLTWLARAGGSRAVGAQAFYPCAFWLFDASLGTLQTLAHFSLDLHPPTVLTATTAVWEVRSDEEQVATGGKGKTAVRIATVLTLPWGKASLRRTLARLRALGPCPDFRVASEFLQEVQPKPKKKARGHLREATPDIPLTPPPEYSSPTATSQVRPDERPEPQPGQVVQQPEPEQTRENQVGEAQEQEHLGVDSDEEESEEEELEDDAISDAMRMHVGLDLDEDEVSDDSAEAEEVNEEEEQEDGEGGSASRSDSDTEDGESFKASACVAIDICEEGGTPGCPGSAQAAWLSRPMEFCREAPLRRSVGPSGRPAIFAVISFILGPGPEGLDHDAVAIIEIDEASGDIRRTFEFPQFSLRPLVSWQWLGPLLAVVETGGRNVGALHIFTFDFGEESEDIGIYEAFRVATAADSCVPQPCEITGGPDFAQTGAHFPPQYSHPDCNIRELMERGLGTGDTDPGKIPFGLSGLWRVNGRSDGESYRYHLRINHSPEGVLKGGGRSMGLEGKAVKAQDGSWSAEFSQTHGGDPTGVCRATLQKGALELQGSWHDAASQQEGFFTARRETSGLWGSRPARYRQFSDWAVSGHRFAMRLDCVNEEKDLRGVVLCEWPQPFAFGKADLQ
ncbi:unnamed protein product, partial [Polarella glacialis]